MMRARLESATLNVWGKLTTRDERVYVLLIELDQPAEKSDLVFTAAEDGLILFDNSQRRFEIPVGLLGDRESGAHRSQSRIACHSTAGLPCEEIRVDS